MIDLVFDLETQRLAGEGGATWKNPATMGLAVAVVLDRESGAWAFYNGPESQQLLIERLEWADRITGWNIINFDLRVIGREDLAPKCLDLLQECRKAMGCDPKKTALHGTNWSLANVALAMLGEEKSSGRDAPRLYQAGMIEELTAY